jgi:hypothetical protein
MTDNPLRVGFWARLCPSDVMPVGQCLALGNANPDIAGIRSSRLVEQAQA